MKILFSTFLVFFLFAATTVQAQQPVQYSLYMLNPYAFNSAYGGLDGSLSATAVFRKQWVSFPGSPLSVNFNAHLPVEFLNSGFGIGLEHDILGAETNTSLQVSYNYILNIGPKAQLSIGGYVGWIQKGLDGSILKAPQGNYEGSVFHNDDFIPDAKIISSALTAGAGIYFKHELFDFGISATNLPAPRVTLVAGSVQEIRYVRDYYLTASYHWEINDNFSLHPSFLLKTDFIKYQPEISVIFKYRNNIFGGMAFRGYSKTTQDAVIFLLGMHITKNLTLAYGYDLSVSKLKSFNTGSHEVVLNYNLHKKIGKEIPPKVIYNPRFL